MYFLDKRQDEVKQMITIIIHKQNLQMGDKCKRNKTLRNIKVACYWSFEDAKKQL